MDLFLGGNQEGNKLQPTTKTIYLSVKSRNKINGDAVNFSICGNLWCTCETFLIQNLDIEHNFPPFGIWDEVAIVSASFCPPKNKSDSFSFQIFLKKDNVGDKRG